MPAFKSTKDILKQVDRNEAFNKNWMDSNTLILPSKKTWDYKRELTVDDVDYWEVLVEETGGMGVYVAWDPYAEFYLITCGIDYKKPPMLIEGKFYWERLIETYYGPGCQEKVFARAWELGLPLYKSQQWVEDEDMWLYDTSSPSKIKKKEFYV